MVLEGSLRASTRGRTGGTRERRRRPATSTATRCEIYLRAYSTLGLRLIGTLRRNEIHAWVNKLSETMAPGGVEPVYGWVAIIVGATIGDRLIAVAPCIRIVLPKKLDTR